MIPGTPKTDIDSYFWSNQTSHQDVNQKSTRGNGVCKGNHDPMGKMEEANSATHWFRPGGVWGYLRYRIWACWSLH